MSDCIHDDLESTTVIIRIPGDIAATHINVTSHMEMQPVMKHHMMFCPERHSVDRFDEFCENLRQKFDEKFNDGMSVERRVL